MNSLHDSLLCLLASLLLSCISAQNVSAIPIAENGEVQATIVVDGQATSARRYAADDLAAHLKQITGGDFRVQFEPADDRPNILVGQPAAGMLYPDFTVEGLGTDGIIIRTMGQSFGISPAASGVHTLSGPFFHRAWISPASTISPSVSPRISSAPGSGSRCA
jgi:hypothetical protein